MKHGPAPLTLSLLANNPENYLKKYNGSIWRKLFWFKEHVSKRKRQQKPEQGEERLLQDAEEEAGVARPPAVQQGTSRPREDRRGRQKKERLVAGHATREGRAGSPWRSLRASIPGQQQE